jgi:DNA-binding transcriptional LysR family regulator
VLGNGKWPGFEAVYLFDEEIFPVCSPDYLTENESDISLGEIGKAKLLDLSFEKTEWLNWTIWFTEMGHPCSNLDIIFKSNSYHSVIAAAANGKGFALGWSYIVNELIEAKRLVAPTKHSVKTGHAYYLVHKIVDSNQTTKVNAFTAWLKQELD